MLSITVNTLVDELDGSIVDGDISLRDAIAAAPVGETIDFAVAGTIDLTLGQLAIDKSLTIIGPGAGMLTIDAGDGTNNLPGDGDGFRVLELNNGNSGVHIDVAISGLTITGGDAVGFGGGIFNQENLSLTDSTITGNSASSGGGITSRYGTLTVMDSEISNNSAGSLYDGGGLFIINGTAIVTDSTISGNSAGRDGGGFFITSGTTTVSGSTISGNSTTSDGGGIYNSGGTVNVIGSTISGNMASAGGGIFNRSGGTTEVTDSTISTNSATVGGGIDNRGTATVTDSTLTGNSANNGGAINNFGTATVTGSTISSNSVPYNGGGISSFGTLSVSSSTISGNSAGNGGGIYKSGGSTATVTNSIVANSTSGGDVSGTLAGSFNLIEDGTGGLGDTIAADPQLGPLADNGGPTFTHAITIASPAFNAGDPSFVGPPNFDQRGAGYVRLVGGRIDIGALEVQAEVPSFVVNLVADTTDLFDNLTSLREAMDFANSLAGADTITFDPTVFATPQTILLGSQLPQITDAVTITGLGADRITLDAGHGTDNVPNTDDGFRIFKIDNGSISSTINVEISGLTLTGGDINGNSSIDINGMGGAIFNSEKLILSDSTISGNSAEVGGGIHDRNQTIITNVTISGNTAFGNGGGIQNLGVMRVFSSTISGNSAANGGGIFNFFIAYVSDSTISDNTALFSGGGIHDSRTTTISNSTISGNSGSTGGGISSSGPATVTNSIVANSTAGGDVFGALVGSFNLIEDGSGGLGDTIAADPQLGPLADNGGPTFTHAISLSSPALDAGDPAFVGPPDFDQRGTGFDRVKNGRLDIGALENEFELPSLIVNVASDTVDSLDGLTSLREAILFANSQAGADTITFDPTVFATPQTILLGSQLPTITDDVTITGLGADRITLDGGNGTDNLPSTFDGFRIFNLDTGFGLPIDVNISGLTLTGGDITGDGGAILNRENLSLTDSTISGNSTFLGDGGGIFNRYGTLIVTGSTLSGNFAQAGDGGGIFNNTSGTTTVTDSTISDNRANNGGGIFNAYYGTLNVTGSTISGNVAGVGGGIYNNQGTTTLTSSTVADNSASSNGGGIFSLGITAGAQIFGRLTVADSTISGNSARNGAGIFSDSEMTSVTGSTISDNSATFGHGGGIYIKSYTTTVTDSTISGNSAQSGNGGGIFNRETTTVMGSTISGNSADKGGGIFNRGTTTVMGSTISGNSAYSYTYSGGGGGIKTSPGGLTTVTNSIVANSLSGGDTSGSLAGSFNLIEDGSGGLGDTLTGNPLLGPLADNGGPTLTHALLTSSPAIDAGDPAAMAGIGEVPLYDQRGVGFGRVQSGRLDIGAFEVPATIQPPALPGDYNLDNVVDAADYTVWRDALGQSDLPPFSGADGNGDGQITSDDYQVWQSHYGQTLPPPLNPVTAFAPVPRSLDVAAPAADAALKESSAQTPDRVQTATPPAVATAAVVTASDALDQGFAQLAEPHALGDRGPSYRFNTSVLGSHDSGQTLLLHSEHADRQGDSVRWDAFDSALSDDVVLDEQTQGSEHRTLANAWGDWA